MTIVALLFIGFSLCDVLLLCISSLLQHGLYLISKIAGFLLLLGLVAIQAMHLTALLNAFDLFESRVYLALLYGIAPCFYFYSRQWLIADSHYAWRDVLHGVPLLFALLLPSASALAMAFLLGAAYLLWLAKVVYGLRAQRQRFRLELLALAILFVIAIAVLILGFVIPLLTKSEFIISYSILIGLALFAVTLTLLSFPSITEDVSDAVQAAYSSSTLKNIDTVAVLAKLEALMTKDKLYTLETLNLELLAEQLSLSQHQLSELINTEFQQGFSRYIRQHRVEEAKRLLITEPNASVLSIGLSVGFSSQSNFYAAFREMVGIAPGQYRKNGRL